ncbi:unnamed protein product [Callosobruchus maculatus]|uniref:Fatty acyl-CoA reductase n=1 Tax=Callosobruchus maculatus TaxID=64391 RepID=A0A653D9H9_CALMS|nr:unnamed protein product [Callosobruchus maculatus]
MSSVIRDFYKGKCVLLTGGTGFFGKMIIGKLLSCCVVKKIYLVVRSKKGQTPKERVEKLLEDPVFKKLIEKQEKQLLKNKLYAFEGDLSKKQLGLTEDNLKIINAEVNLVFHCGAFLNMDAKLYDAVITNVRGTAEMIKIVKAIQNLQAFILISTAYSQCKKKNIEERLYKSPIDPELLISMAEQLDGDFLNKLSTT